MVLHSEGLLCAGMKLTGGGALLAVKAWVHCHYIDPEFIKIFFKTLNPKLTFESV